MPASDAEGISIGERLRLARGRTPQAAFARELGIHLSTYSRYERGERLPDAEILLQLDQKGFSPDWILLGRQTDAKPKVEFASEALQQTIQAVLTADYPELRESDFARLARTIVNVYTLVTREGS